MHTITVFDTDLAPTSLPHSIFFVFFFPLLPFCLVDTKHLHSSPPSTCLCFAERSQSCLCCSHRKWSSPQPAFFFDISHLYVGSVIQAKFRHQPIGSSGLYSSALIYLTPCNTPGNLLTSANSIHSR